MVVPHRFCRESDSPRYKGKPCQHIFPWPKMISLRFPLSTPFTPTATRFPQATKRSVSQYGSDMTYSPAEIPFPMVAQPNFLRLPLYKQAIHRFRAICALFQDDASETRDLGQQISRVANGRFQIVAFEKFRLLNQGKENVKRCS